jgi:oligopeptide/dipeptide ABC transporter ATP-binding protein
MANVQTANVQTANVVNGADVVAQPALLDVSHLSKSFPVRRGWLQRGGQTVRAVNDVSFTIARGETLGVVGESGCGKTTMGRSILRLIEPTSGSVLFDGVDLATLSGASLRAMRRRIQVVFQDPFSSLNPRMTVGAAVKEGILIHRIAEGSEADRRVRVLFEEVGLNPAYASRYPHEFSGGQRQRIGVARALSVEPELIVCDEPVSALDVSVQAQVINLLQDLQRDRGLTYLFIAHDLSVVQHIADRVAVMYLGRIVEIGSSHDLYSNPKMPYTQALLSAVPRPEPGRHSKRIVLQGEPPSPANPPPGCVFYPRCHHPLKDEACTKVIPPLEEKTPNHFAACIKEPPSIAEPPIQTPAARTVSQ